MKRATGFLVLAVAVGAAFASTAAAHIAKAENCGGYCLYTSPRSGWSFDGRFRSRPQFPADKPWLRLGNAVDWKLALVPKLAGNVRAEIHLGSPVHPGRLLALLCAPCGAAAHGTF